MARQFLFDLVGFGGDKLMASLANFVQFCVFFCFLIYVLLFY